MRDLLGLRGVCGVLVVLVMLSVSGARASASETRIIEDENLVIETFLFGEGNETLVIAAGNGRPAAQLEELAIGIAAEGIRVVTYNYRSIGSSTGQIDGLTLHDYARDIWRIADALGLEKVHLAGKTFGNRVVRTAASDEPGRTLSVILIGAGGDALPSRETQALYRRYVDPKISAEEWQELQGVLMFAPGNEHLASRSAALGSYPELAAAQGRANSATPSDEWLSGGSSPMLVVACLLDRLAVPENGLSFAKSRPNTRFVGLPGCGHNMVYERPDALIRLSVEFVRRQSESRANTVGDE